MLVTKRFAAAYFGLTCSDDRGQVRDRIPCAWRGNRACLEAAGLQAVLLLWSCRSRATRRVTSAIIQTPRAVPPAILRPENSAQN